MKVIITVPNENKNLLFGLIGQLILEINGAQEPNAEVHVVNKYVKVEEIKESELQS